MDLFSRQVEPYTPGTHAIPDSALPGLTEETAERIAQALVNAERPLIYFGGGLRTPEAKQALLALAEHLDIPLAHSLMGKGAIPDRHPLLLGMPGFWGLDSTHAHTKDADVVLALATRFAETDASSWEAAYTWNFPPSKLIQIDIDPAEIGRNYPVEIGAVADVGHSVRAIGAAVRALQPAPTRRPGLREAIATSRAELFQNADENGASDNFPLRPQRILADLRASLPADTILVTDVGWNKNGVAQSYDLPPQGRFITPGGASTMGFGPAAAVGVQMAQPQRTVVALIGDGGMSAQLPAVPMAVEQGLPVIFAVMNNRAHGTISDLQRSNYGRGYGCDFTGPDGQPYSPDFAAYGRSCGADGYEVATAEDLAKVISTAVERRRPAVIDIPMVNEPVPTPGHWNINDIYQGTFQDEG
nr:thiamine pyrophosphate-binding protein [Streptomyces sp. SID14446]